MKNIKRAPEGYEIRSKSLRSSVKRSLPSWVRRRVNSIPLGRDHFHSRSESYLQKNQTDQICQMSRPDTLNAKIVQCQGLTPKLTKRMKEIGYLLSRMMKNVQTARANYETQRKTKRLNSIATRPVECGTYSMGSNNFHSPERILSSDEPLVRRLLPFRRNKFFSRQTK